MANLQSLKLLLLLAVFFWSPQVLSYSIDYFLLKQELLSQGIIQEQTLSAEDITFVPLRLDRTGELMQTAPKGARTGIGCTVRAPKILQINKTTCGGGSHCSYRRTLHCLTQPKLRNIPNIALVTMLRHPVDRVLSEFYAFQDNYEFRKNFPSQMVTEILPLQSVNEALDKFIQFESNPAHNRQARMLSGLKVTLGMREPCSDESHSWILWENYYKNGPKAGPRANPSNSWSTMLNNDPYILDSANQTLHNLAFFGITEKFDETCHLLGKVYSMKTRHQVHSNPLAPDVDPGDAVRNAIMEKNWVDMKLYEEAVQLFNRRYKTALKFFPEMKD